MSHRFEYFARRLPHCIAVAASLLAVAPAAAQVATAYPVKPVRLIVPYPPGGSVDFTGRELAQKLSEAWGQQVVLDNRGGAGSTLGHGLGAKATPDGYTLLLGTSAGLVVSPLSALASATIRSRISCRSGSRYMRHLH